MKSIVLLLLLIGIILVTLGVSKGQQKKCPIEVQTKAVSDSYLNQILSSADNYKDIFSYGNIGIPNKNLSTEKSNEQSNGDDDNDNIHNLI